MKNRYILLIPALALFLTGFATRSYGVTWQVDVSNFVFTPASISNVKVGDTVRFHWVSGTHTTTSTTIPAGAATWNHPISSSSQTYDYVPTVLGTYNYKCTPHAAMGMVGSFTVTVMTGVSDPKKALAVEVYPNPVQSTATITLKSDPSHVLGLTIYDMTGKTLLSRELENVAQNESVTLDLGSLSSGIYFARFEDAENGATVVRIVKKP